MKDFFFLRNYIKGMSDQALTQNTVQQPCKHRHTHTPNSANTVPSKQACSMTQ